MSARCVSALRPLTRPSLVEDNQAAAAAPTGSLSVCEGRSAQGPQPIRFKPERLTRRGLAEMCLLFSREDATQKM